MEEYLSNNDIKRPSFLDSFFIEKLNRYNEPQRKGTPRGEPIGLSKQKYQASLLMLKSFPLRDLGKRIGVSHGLLRKWRTEEPFKEQIRRHESDFVFRVSIHMTKRGERQKKLENDYFEKPVEYIAGNPPPELTWNEFNDMRDYSPSLAAAIIGGLLKIHKNLIKTCGNLMSDMSIDWSDDDLLKLAVHGQIITFLNILKGHPFRKKDARKIIKKFNIQDDRRQESYYLTIQYRIAREWSNSGAISENSLKKISCVLHNLAGKFTPVDII